MIVIGGRREMQGPQPHPSFEASPRTESAVADGLVKYELGLLTIDHDRNAPANTPRRH